MLTDPAIVAMGAATVVVALITGFVTWQVAKRKSAVDYAAVVQKGFKALIDELRTQHEDDQSEIKILRKVVADLSFKIRELSRDLSTVRKVLRDHGIEDKMPDSGLIGIPPP